MIIPEMLETLIEDFKKEASRLFGLVERSAEASERYVAAIRQEAWVLNKLKRLEQVLGEIEREAAEGDRDE